MSMQAVAAPSACWFLEERELEKEKELEASLLPACLCKTKYRFFSLFPPLIVEERCDFSTHVRLFVYNLIGDGKRKGKREAQETATASKKQQRAPRAPPPLDQARDPPSSTWHLCTRASPSTRRCRALLCEDDARGRHALREAQSRRGARGDGVGGDRRGRGRG